MKALTLLITLIFAILALVGASPLPDPGWKKHEHYIIHVPYTSVKHIHHHHVKKVPVYIKSHGWNSGWNSGSSGWNGWSSGWDWD